MTDQELRTRQAYRLVAAIAILLVAGITVWMVKPPPKVDLRFLATLNPVLSREERSTSSSMEFKQSQAEVERLLDAHLNAATNWVKDSSAYGWTIYRSHTRGLPLLTLISRPPSGIATVPVMSSSPPPASAIPSPSTVAGATLDINDPRGVAIFP